MDDSLQFTDHIAKLDKKYDEYIKFIKNKNSLSILDETENYLLDLVNSTNEGYVSEDGVVEKWVGGIDKKKFTKDLKQYVSNTREKLKKELND